MFFSCPLEGRLLAAQFHPTHLYLISVLAWWLALYLNMHRHSGSQHGDHAYLFTSAGNVSCQFLPFSGFMHTRCNTTVLISAQMENVHTSLKYIKHWGVCKCVNLFYLFFYIKMVNLREYIYANTKLELNISYILKKVMIPPFFFFFFLSFSRYHGWIQPLWRSAGCTAVHSHRNHSCHSNYYLHLYP